jgi:GT2 family glycosyltransferase
MTSSVKISVLIASRRTDESLRICLESLALQRHAPPFEVLVASSDPPPDVAGLLTGWIRVEHENPALRRNRAADFAAGDLLAFLDDDARAAPDWLERALEISRRSPLFGGIDIGTSNAPYAERLSDLLLSTPFLGSGVAAHQRIPRAGPIRHAADLSSCNLFIRREAFDRLGGFDETIGFGGEDSDLVRRSVAQGLVPELDPRLIVFHRRPRFPFEYLSRRWSLRVKTGRLLAAGKSGAPGRTIAAFLLSGALAVAASRVWGARFLVPASSLWAIAVWTASFSIWKSDARLFPVVPAAFLLHHAVYALATLAGVLSGTLRRAGPRVPTGPARVESPTR